MPDRCRARLVYRPEYVAYDFGPQHPLRPERHRVSLDLLAEVGLDPAADEWLAPPAATSAELERVHSPGYLEAVQRLDRFGDDPAVVGEATRWGLGPGDSPAFAGMHPSSAAIAGGTLHAVRGVLQGDFTHAFNPAGGLHHAMPERASGFCIYNDPAVAIAAALQEHAARVLYLDFDAHHGDGVQAAFYAEPRALTFSIHESGRYLFPLTGFVDELGEGAGRGFSLNLPVEPYTEDDAWLAALELLLPPLAEWFAPDLIVSQHGCDSHAWDPLTHLNLSTRAYAAQAHLVHALAHQTAHGRWVATGGGGYDWVRVVPRSWAIIWAEMSARDLPELLPEGWKSRWAETARRRDFWPLPDRFLDNPEALPHSTHRLEIGREVQARAEVLLELVANTRRDRSGTLSGGEQPG